jgi:hypothetical protein
VDLISSNVLAAPAPTVTFTAIPGTFNHLKLVILAATDSASENDYLVIEINADSAAHYDIAEAYTDDGSTWNVASGNGLGGLSASVLKIPAASATAGAPGAVEIDIPCYAQTAFNKLVKMTGGYVDTRKALTDAAIAVFLGLWRNTAAVTGISFAPALGSNFVVGSAFYLYGIT